ncbi:hypothetical protein C8F04DRAFT_1199964 [Mycena alexandri]|uniref:Uncharacterized protein n=1 Tax=Mycena alexandri TaxID=1745969 RepID=A0AAD6RYM8_9AGAR|nr:hypothetical protein C8F04DRAFT_1199964 [Mycena alexandri]
MCIKRIQPEFRRKSQGSRSGPKLVYCSQQLVLIAMVAMGLVQLLLEFPLPYAYHPCPQRRKGLWSEGAFCEVYSDSGLVIRLVTAKQRCDDDDDNSPIQYQRREASRLHGN